ncbi:MAG: CarD family transcriptional regulator [Lachnospiraceae bacterium]
MFSIGDYVVYGNNGICVIKDVAPLDLPGMSADNLYYVLSPVGPKESKIYSPVDNQKIVMRGVLTKKEAQSILDNIDSIGELDVVNDKMMEQRYKEIIASCDITRLISMIKTIKSKQALRAQTGKKITATDERFLKRAMDSVYDELAMALEMERSEVEQRLLEGLFFPV